MKVLIDTNVVLDIMLNRVPFYTSSADVYALAVNNAITGFISASAITDIFFIAKGTLGKKPTKEVLKNLLSVFKPATVTDKNIFKALDLDWEDFEDSVQFIIGEELEVDYIVTRNIQDFASSSISAVTPDIFLQIVADIEM